MSPTSPSTLLPSANDDLDLPTLLLQMQETISQIHQAVTTLQPSPSSPQNGEDHAKLTEIESRRDSAIRSLLTAFSAESESLSQKRRVERDEILARRRAEDEELARKRREEDQEREEKLRQEDDEREQRLERDKGEVERETDELMGEIERGWERRWEEERGVLRGLERRRKELNRLIEEKLQAHTETPLPLNSRAIREARRTSSLHKMEPEQISPHHAHKEAGETTETRTIQRGFLPAAAFESAPPDLSPHAHKETGATTETRTIERGFLPAAAFESAPPDLDHDHDHDRTYRAESQQGEEPSTREDDDADTTHRTIHLQEKMASTSMDDLLNEPGTEIPDVKDVPFEIDEPVRESYHVHERHLEIKRETTDAGTKTSPVDVEFQGLPVEHVDGGSIGTEIVVERGFSGAAKEAGEYKGRHDSLGILHPCTVAADDRDNRDGAVAGEAGEAGEAAPAQASKSPESETSDYTPYSQPTPASPTVIPQHHHTETAQEYLREEHHPVEPEIPTTTTTTTTTQEKPSYFPSIAAHATTQHPHFADSIYASASAAERGYFSEPEAAATAEVVHVTNPDPDREPEPGENLEQREPQQYPNPPNPDQDQQDIDTVHEPVDPVEGVERTIDKVDGEWEGQVQETEKEKEKEHDMEQEEQREQEREHEKGQEHDGVTDNETDHEEEAEPVPIDQLVREQEQMGLGRPEPHDEAHCEQDVDPVQILVDMPLDDSPASHVVGVALTHSDAVHMRHTPVEEGDHVEPAHYFVSQHHVPRSGPQEFYTPAEVPLRGYDDHLGHADASYNPAAHVDGDTEQEHHDREVPDVSEDVQDLHVEDTQLRYELYERPYTPSDLAPTPMEASFHHMEHVREHDEMPEADSPTRGHHDSLDGDGTTAAAAAAAAHVHVPHIDYIQDQDTEEDEETDGGYPLERLASHRPGRSVSVDDFPVPGQAGHRHVHMEPRGPEHYIVRVQEGVSSGSESETESEDFEGRDEIVLHHLDAIAEEDDEEVEDELCDGVERRHMAETATTTTTEGHVQAQAQADRQEVEEALSDEDGVHRIPVDERNPTLPDDEVNAEAEAEAEAEGATSHARDAAIESAPADMHVYGPTTHTLARQQSEGAEATEDSDADSSTEPSEPQRIHKQDPDPRLSEEPPALDEAPDLKAGHAATTAEEEHVSHEHQVEQDHAHGQPGPEDDDEYDPFRYPPPKKSTEEGQVAPYPSTSPSLFPSMPIMSSSASAKVATSDSSAAHYRDDEEEEGHVVNEANPSPQEQQHQHMEESDVPMDDIVAEQPKVERSPDKVLSVERTRSVLSHQQADVPMDDITEEADVERRSPDKALSVEQTMSVLSHQKAARSEKSLAEELEEVGSGEEEESDEEDSQGHDHHIRHDEDGDGLDHDHHAPPDEELKVAVDDMDQHQHQHQSGRGYQSSDEEADGAYGHHHHDTDYSHQNQHDDVEVEAQQSQQKHLEPPILQLIEPSDTENGEFPSETSSISASGHPHVVTREDQVMGRDWSEVDQFLSESDSEDEPHAGEAEHAEEAGADQGDAAAAHAHPTVDVDIDAEVEAALETPATEASRAEDTAELHEYYDEHVRMHHSPEVAEGQEPDLGLASPDQDHHDQEDKPSTSFEQQSEPQYTKEEEEEEDDQTVTLAHHHDLPPLTIPPTPPSPVHDPMSHHVSHHDAQSPGEEEEKEFVPRDVTNRPWRSDTVNTVATADTTSNTVHTVSSPQSARSGTTLSSGPSSPVEESASGQDPRIRDSTFGAADMGGRAPGLTDASVTDYSGGGYGAYGHDAKDSREPVPKVMETRHQREATSSLSSRNEEARRSGDSERSHSHNLGASSSRSGSGSGGGGGGGGSSLFQRMRSVFEQSSSSPASASPQAAAPTNRVSMPSFFTKSQSHTPSPSSQSLFENTTKQRPMSTSPYHHGSHVHHKHEYTHAEDTSAARAHTEQTEAEEAGETSGFLDQHHHQHQHQRQDQQHNDSTVYGRDRDQNGDDTAGDDGYDEEEYERQQREREREKRRERRRREREREAWREGRHGTPVHSYDHHHGGSGSGSGSRYDYGEYRPE